MKTADTPHRPTLEIYSSVGGAAFFEGMVTTWEQAGWQVNRHHALTEQEYRAPRTRLQRIKLRWRMYGQFAWKCWWTARRSRRAAPLRIVTTNPFYAPALVQRASGERGATIHLLYDLYPDALVQAGVLRADSWLAGRCAATTRAALRDCAATVFLGEHLRQHTEARYGAARRAVVIPVGADGTPFRDAPPQSGGPGQDITILYAGQMGRMHDIETLSHALDDGVPAGIRLQFQSSGAGYAQLRKQHEATPGCQWGGPLGDAAWQQTMKEAQVALVTIAAEGENVVMPSKTYGALVAGQAILAICAPQSDLADLVRSHQCGWIIAPGDVAGLRNCWQEICANPAALLEKRRRAYAAGQSMYDSRIVAGEWEKLFDELLMP